jgi:uncharacterized protein
MATRTDTFDLGALRLTSGEGRHLDLDLVLQPFELGGHHYTVGGAGESLNLDAPRGTVVARLDISRMTGQGYALRLSFDAALHGPCMRCLEPANPEFHVDSREVSQPGEDADEFESPYVTESILDVGAWAHDALALALPATLLHAPDCLGLCPVCGVDLNTAGPEHHHAPEPDPRWAVLSELTFDAPAAETPAPTDPEADSSAEAGAGLAPEAGADSAPEPGTTTG